MIKKRAGIGLIRKAKHKINNKIRIQSAKNKRLIKKSKMKAYNKIVTTVLFGICKQRVVITNGEVMISIKIRIKHIII